MPFPSVAAVAVAALLATISRKASAAYQPCPLLKAYYPPPAINKTSPEIQALSAEFSAMFDDLVQSGLHNVFGEITPNTTSFSVVMFSAATDSAKDTTFFEYHYTAPLANVSTNVTADTVFPAGSLTQLFTSYLWLIEAGDGEWDTPITHFLPELLEANVSSDAFSVPWDDVTIGALASHMSGIARDSGACTLGLPCERQEFVNAFAATPPVFMPDTTPIVSNAAFQLLALALSEASRKSPGEAFADLLSSGVLGPLAMENSELFSINSTTSTFGNVLDPATIGEPASHGLLTTTSDLARAGSAMLSSKLIPASATRRWLQPIADTSNLRNGVGRPWEIYHAGQYANSSIIDVYTKTGSIGPFSSYFGLAPDFNSGFAILAHDAGGTGAPDLNVYADVVSGAVESLLLVGVQQLADRLAGTYGSTQGGDDMIVFNVTTEPGLTVESMLVNQTDLRLEAAQAAGIEVENLDFKLYPTNIKTVSQYQFVAVLQDKTAPVDADTPTCITWMDVGALAGVPSRVVFQLDDQGSATAVELPTEGRTIPRSV